MTTSVQLALAFMVGTLIRLTASFTRAPTQAEIDDGTACDLNDWQPVDPDTVTAQVGKVVDGAMDTGTISEHAYQDSPGDIVRDEAGKYHLDITASSPNVGPVTANHWAYRFESTGNGQAVSEARFVVSPSEFG